MQDIHNRAEQDAKRTEELEEANKALSKATRDHEEHNSQKTQKLAEDLGVIIPRIQQLLEHSDEGKAQVQALQYAWGCANNNTTKGDSALTKIISTIQEALDTITRSTKKKNWNDQARDMLNRKHEHKIEEITAIFASMKKTVDSTARRPCKNMVLQRVPEKIHKRGEKRLYIPHSKHVFEVGK